MKGGTPLDCVEFQLTPTGNRCELFVSADGVTEKLASGFLKPFVTHLRAAEVQVARGCQVVRLEEHRNFSEQTDNTWFTKGTLERFVRFVSTPEVLERVKTIEDELGQLEQVRNALAKTFVRTEERSPSIDTAFFPSGGYPKQDAVSIMPRRHSMDGDDNAEDASKRELLRAMEARLIALKQEQGLAFSRAAAAGFDSSNMADLITFAKTFGADRLNDACLQFIALLRKRKSSAGGYEEIDSPSGEGASSGSDMSLESCNESDLAAESEETSSRNFSAWLKEQKRTDSDAKKKEEDWAVKMRETDNLDSSIGNDGTRTRSTGTRRRWGPPEKLQMGYSSSQTHSSQDSPESKMGQDDKSLRESEMISGQAGVGFCATNHLEKYFSLPQQEQTVVPDSGWKLMPRRSPPANQSIEPNSKGGMFFTRLQQMAQRVEARRCEDLGGRMHETMMGMDGLSQPDSQVGAHYASSPASSSSNNGHSSMVPSSSPLSEKSLALPARVVQTEHSQLVCPSSVTIQNVSHSPPLQNGMAKEKDSLKKPESNHTKEGEVDNAKGTNEESVSTSDRRLSVQAAISLFESRKSDSVEPPLRKVQGSHRGSMESGSPSIPEKNVLRRWSGTNLLSLEESCRQERGTALDSPEARINQEPNFVKHKDGANKDTSGGSTLMQNAHSQPKAEQTVIEKSKTSHLQQPEQTGLLMPSEAVSPAIKQNSPGSTSRNIHGEDLEKQFRIDLAKSLARVARNNAAKEMVISSRSEGESTKAATRPTKNSGTELLNENQSSVNSRRTQQDVEMRWSGQSTGHILHKLGTFNGPKMASHGTREHGNAEHMIMTSSSDESVPVKVSDKFKETTGDSVHNVTKIAGHILPKLGTSNVPKIAPLATQEHNSLEQVIMTCSKQESVPVKVPEKCKETTDDSVHIVTEIGSRRSSGDREKNSTREFSNNVWSTPLDFHMDALVEMVDNHGCDSLMLSHEESCHGERERFHEYYDKLRDARRRREHPAKRAEKEAKLKFMREIFEIRIAEMEESFLKPQRNDPHIAQVQLSIKKLHPQKADLLVAQMEQDELRDGKGTNPWYNSSQMQDLSYEFSNPTSPASAPRLAQNQASALKSHTVKKTVPTLSKSLTAPRASIRTGALVSPRSTQKNMSGAPGQQNSLSPSDNGNVDNSLSRSVSNSTDLRKETVKPSSARAVASAKVNLKVHGHSRTASDGSLLADNNASANDDLLSGSADKEEMKHRLSLIKKNLTSGSELKALSAQAFDSTDLESLKGQQERCTDSDVFGKARRNLGALAQEVKPFLRKGRGIGPGAGPGVMKQKLSVPFDACKSSDEDRAIDSLLNGETDYALPGNRILEPQDLKKALVADDFKGSLECKSLGTSNVPVMHVLYANGSLSVNEGLPVDLKVKSSDKLPEDASNYDRVRPSTFSPDDLYDENHQGTLSGDPILFRKGSFPEPPNCEPEHAVLSAPISELLAWKNMDVTQTNGSFVTSSVPFWAGALLHEHGASPFYPVATTAESLSVPQCGSASGDMSPPSGVGVDSPLGSPLSWNSTQTHFPSDTDVARSQRPSSGPLKAASTAAQPPKEPAKGFKRLLHFGWKTRTSETATTDLSASTTSEGDDDTEEARNLGNHSSDEFLLRARMQEGVFEYGNSGDHHNFQDHGTIQMLRTSIPAPPVNFKLREDHLSGSSLLKAPRSFFSLPSFRSRGSEGKSR